MFTANRRIHFEFDMAEYPILKMGDYLFDK